MGSGFHNMNVDIIEVSTIIAIIGCFVGLAGWLSGRDKKIISEAQWRGSVDSKLDLIIGIRTDINNNKGTINNHSERITVAENKINALQKEIDEFRRINHD